MRNRTCFSDLAIERDAEGDIVLSEVRSAQSEIAARCLAAAMAATRPGAVALSHTGDLSSGDLADLLILDCYGEREKRVLCSPSAVTKKLGHRRKRLGARRLGASGGASSRWPYFAQMFRRSVR
jgi:hypothetical protein